LDYNPRNYEHAVKQLFNGMLPNANFINK
jgi:hypothetical protein